MLLTYLWLSAVMWTLHNLREIICIIMSVFDPVSQIQLYTWENLVVCCSIFLLSFQSCFRINRDVVLNFSVYFLLFVRVRSCQYQCKWLPGKTGLRNDILCVERDVKLYSPVLFGFCVNSSFVCLVLCCQYQCKWLPRMTYLPNDLLSVKQEVKLWCRS